MLKRLVEEFDELKKKRKEKVSRKKLLRMENNYRNVILLLQKFKIIETEYSVIFYNNYIATRLKVGLCLLAITGIGVNKLLTLKIHQLKTLLAASWIKNDCYKRDSASHKSYLSKQEKLILKSSQNDFDLLYLY